jgi:hypothetical protein
MRIIRGHNHEELRKPEINLDIAPPPVIDARDRSVGMTITVDGIQLHIPADTENPYPA